ncbi:facilitated trehalose transporter Tret1-2 homolog isoform X2 [Belonocnema kinseyi]|uniref:facilitated trehalose transporter Tret1-2 homolog isoform X2 n=1 Tax=Belonocnema kinseyi TaxID=2817044 RepID=UPI00143D9790|nr:facilitated trehalose transporter Tret1-2 homolog isoform X2 [Belonocnema kinseyi]
MDVSEHTNSDEIVQSRNQYVVQFMSILTGYVLVIDGGAHAAWTSPALPHLTSEKAKFSVTSDQGAWIASLFSPPAIIGYVTNCLLVDRIGRRFTILVFAASHLTSWILINFAENYSFLIIARLVAGFSCGGISSFLPAYIGEVAGKKIRGRFLAFDRICVSVGAFLITILGAFFSYKTMNLVMISLPIISICLSPFMVETPYYYLMKGQDKKAVKTLMKLSGLTKSEIIMVDIERMKTAIESQNPEISSMPELFKDRASQKALFIMLLAFMTYAFSGTIAIQAYAQVIFKQSGSSLAPEYAAMIITGVQIFAGLPSTQLIDYWGRRPVYVFSGITSAIALGTVALYFFLKDFLGTNLTSVKGKAVMITSAAASIFLFTTKIMTPMLNDSLGVYTTFWIFSGVCLLGPLIIVYITPETKGANLEEVLILLSGKNKPKQTDISRQH